jgi:hypothetical protein
MEINAGLWVIFVEEMVKLRGFPALERDRAYYGGEVAAWELWT